MARRSPQLIEEIASAKAPADEVKVKLITSEDTENEERARKQLEFLAEVRAGALVGGVHFDVSFDAAIHDRSIVTDNGWRILLGRGLDIFQYFTGGAFDLATRRQEYRQVKAFGITYMRDER